MPELGKYAFAVLSSYGVSILLIAVLAWMSVSRGRKLKRRMEEVEEQMKRHG